jgi:chemotaxis protein histidine kinase CheA
MPPNNEALQKQLVNDLLIESFEGLDRFDRELLALEKGEAQPDVLNIIFRVIHTIKGTAGCIGLGKIESVAHVGENLLSLLRDGKLTINPAIIGALLEYSDALKELMRCLEQTGQQGDKDYSALLEKLKKLQTGEPVAEAKPVAEQGWGLFADEPAAVAAAPVPAPAPVADLAPVAELAPAAAPVVPEKAAVETAGQRAGPSVTDTAIRVDVGQLDKLMNLVGELVLARNQIVQFTGSAAEPTLLNAAQRLNIITTELQESVMKTRMQPIGNVWTRFPRVVRDIAHELGKQVKLVMEGQETELDRTIIEAIKDPLTHIIRNSLDHGFEKPDVRVATGKPAEGLLILRAFHEGGQVNIEIMDDGQGINIVRVKQKAVERALLAPDQAAGLSDREAFNLIFLPGFSTAEKVTNVSGRGVGMDVVKTNIEKIGGSVDVFSEAGQGTTLKIKIPLTLAIIPALIVSSGTERFAIPQVNLLELVRLEGEQARAKIESLYGSPVYRLRGQLLPLVYLNKTLSGGDGQPSAVSDKLHNHHAGDTGEVFLKARDAHRAWLGKLQRVIDGSMSMTLEEAGSHKHCMLGKWIYSEGLKDYGDLSEIHALEKAHEHFHNLVKEVVVERNANNLEKAEAGLKNLSGVSEKVVGCLADAEKKVQASQNVNIVVLHADGRQFGLVVDAINDTEEIVVKPLGKLLKGIPCFAGATIMGDGRVALILDVIGLAQVAKLIGETGERLATKTEEQTRADDRQTLLLFTAGENSRLAIPLSTVARLEEFPLKSIERAGGQDVVQYRGQILPLINVAQILANDTSTAAPLDPVQVVVYSESGRSVGLVVGKISDIVEEALTVKRDVLRHGVTGSAVIQNQVTDLLDVPGIIRAADPEFFNQPKEIA